MSLRDHNSRQIDPSFLPIRSSASPDAMRGHGRSIRTSLARAASKKVSRGRSGRGTPRIHRSMQIMKRSSLVFLPFLSGHTLRANSDALRHCAALLSGLLSQSKFGPLLQNARLGTWESGLSLGLRQGVTRSIREFN
jgi:hypothetical protein